MNLKNLWALVCFVASVFLFSSVRANNNYGYLNYGITLCGAEFGEQNLPGTLNVHYTYPTTADIDYFASKGINLIQLPFKWERMQRVPGGPFDATELSLLSKFVDDCAARNINVTLVLQNFGRYKINGVQHIVGGPVVTAAHLKDFWRKMAVAMMNKYNVFGFSLMTEPHDMGQYPWANTAQEAINGIREIDRVTTILVDGDNYSNPYTWIKYNDNLKNLYDPINKILFNAHCYFDEDYSGSYKRSYDACGANPMTGVERVKPFVEWLRNNNKQGFVGEYGVPKNDQRWLKVLDNFLDYLKMNNIGGCYWAAGAWWKDYHLSIQPVNNTDQPQLSVIAKYIQYKNKLNEGNIKREEFASLR